MRATDRGRRAAALLVLILAAAAVIATSPPMEPAHQVTAIAEGSVVLTDEAPIASFVIELDASDEALWSDDPLVRVSQARLDLTTEAIWADGGANEAGAPSVRLTTVAVGGQAPIDDEQNRLGAVTVDLLANCAELRDCALSYEAIVEWLDPRADASARVTLRANASSEIVGPEVAPVDAEVVVAVDEAGPVDDPSIGDVIEEQGVTLAADRPLVMRHVTVRANAAAVPAALEWPLDPRGALVTSLSVDPPPDNVPLVGAGAIVSLIPDDAVDAQEGLEELTAGGSTPFAPFQGCMPGQPCERAFTLVIAWFSPDPALVATVDWQLTAGIAFHGDAAPGHGATVEIEVDGRTNVTADGARLRATAEGTVTLDRNIPRGNNEEVGVTLDVPRAALDPDALGGPIPALTGTFAVEATASRSLGEEPLAVSLGIGPETLLAQPGYSLRPVVGGPRLSAPIFPGRGCRAGTTCELLMGLTFHLGPAELDRLTDTDRIEVHWAFEVTLAYPDGVAVPPGADIELVGGDSP